MIPRTFPSSRASNGSTQMIVYFLPSVSGLTRWVDYIPVKFTTVATAATENTYNQNGYIPVVSISSIAGATPFKEYVPVFLDSSAADADVWDVNITGFIPVGTAGIGGAALYMDFAATTTLDPRVTFSRTTNATLTNSAGLVANAPMNLLTFSEQFDNAAWIKSGATITANSIAAPNGTTTADKLSEDSATSTHRTLQASTLVSGTAYTTSVYVKSSERTRFVLCFSDGVTTYGRGFDLTTQTSFATISGEVAPTTSSIISVGNGWYRLSITVTSAGTSGNVQFRLLNSGDSTNYTGVSGYGMYIWGAQLELGSTATTYNPTTVKNLLGFTEHFDNAAWTKSNAFVQTNLVTYSQDFDNAAWAKTRATVTANSTAAPDGTLTAESLIEDTSASSTHFVRQTTTVVSGTAYVVSVYLKASTRNWAIATIAAGNGYYFNLSAGTVGSASGGSGTVSNPFITSVGDGWYRCGFTVVAGSTTGGVDVYTATGDGVAVYTGNGTSGIFLWGAQLVQGTSAGDYKATYAAAAAVGYTDIYGQPFAQKLVEDTATSSHYVQQVGSVVSGTPYVYSIYAKAGERTLLSLLMAQSTSPFTNHALVEFNLTTGTISNTVAGSGSITSVGNGWYRCSVFGTASSANEICRAYYTNTGDGTSGIYIFGAQLSDSASVDPYVYQPVAAPSSVAYYGPRFDYDPATLAPKGLLIEEQRTNLLTYSEDFTNAAWVKSNSTVTANSVVAPDGTTTADKIVSNAASTGSMFRATGVSSAQTITFSLYAKAAEWRYLRFQLGASFSPQPAAWFDLQTGVVVSQGGTGASIQSVGGGWYRLIVVSTWVNATDSNAYFNPSNNSSSYTTGDGTSGVYIWGAQLEAGAFATSYIPTVASQVTRAADSASMIGNNFARWYNQGPGTVYAEFLLNSAAGTFPSAYSINDGTANNRIQPYQNSALTSIGFDITTGGAAQAAINITVPNLTTAYVRHAGAYQTNSVNAAANGTLGTEDTSVTLAPYNRLGLGSNALAQNANCWIKRFTYYNRKFTPAEQQGITS